jgi:DNA-3-methyladenine glycosylase II
MGKVTVRFQVVPERPYSLGLTAERFTRFPEVVDRFDGRFYRRLLPIGRGGVLVTVEQSGPASKAILSVRLDGARARSAQAGEAARRILERSLGASTPVSRFYRAHRRDEILGPPIRAFRGLRIAGVPSLWEALVTAVLAQQVNLRFAYDIRRELCLAYGRRARFFGETYVAFPGPEPFAGESLRRLRRFRLSRSKAVAIREIARAFENGGLSEEILSPLPDEDAIARLVALRGVGRWTAEIGLLRGLGRTDIFPAGDLGVVKYLAQGLFGHATTSKAKEEDMRRFAERWAPDRGLALVYGYAELNRRRSSPFPPGPRPSGRPSPETAPSRAR